MNIWTKIKFGIGAAVSLALVVMHAMVRRSNALKDKAERVRGSAQRSERAGKARAELDASISRAGAKARQESAQAAEVRNEQTTNERRTGRQLGGTDRLR